MKVGDKIPIVFEVIRQADHGEKFTSRSGEVTELDNHFQNLFWAAPLGEKKPEILVCSASIIESTKKLELRDKIFHMIEDLYDPHAQRILHRIHSS